MKLKKS